MGTTGAGSVEHEHYVLQAKYPFILKVSDPNMEAFVPVLNKI